MRRAVRFLVEQGIDQFLDLGSGIPTIGNVHEIAQAANPQARVLYVDVDPIAVAHSASLLRDNPLALVLQADIREPEILLERVQAQGLLDFSRPVAVLLAFVLHFVTEDSTADHIVQTLRSVMAAGSYLVISHSTGDGPSPSVHDSLICRYKDSTIPVVSRKPEVVARWFSGLDLVEPGIVRTPLWRPESAHDLYLDEPQRASSCAGVAMAPFAGPPASPVAAC